MAESRLLTALERARFASWLEENAESARLIVGQMEKMQHNPAMDSLIKQNRFEELACRFIAIKLLSTIDESIG